VPPIVFQRRPAPSPRGRDVLEQFSGDYMVLDQMMSVTIKGEDALLLSLPGQPAYELESYKGTLFVYKDLVGLSVEFKRDAAGMVAEALIVQPGGVSTARKT